MTRQIINLKGEKRLLLPSNNCFDGRCDRHERNTRPNECFSERDGERDLDSFVVSQCISIVLYSRFPFSLVRAKRLSEEM